MTLIQRVAALVLLVLSNQIAQAVDRPARLVVGEDSIEELLILPKDLPQGRYEVFCEALIGGVTARAHRPYCYPIKTSRQERLADAVERAVRKARFLPATRNDATLDVFMVMMAIITITEQEPLVLVVPNNGVEQARFGLLYTAPQRTNEFTWDDPSFPRWRDGSVLVWWHLDIDAQGRVTQKRLRNLSGASEILLRTLERHIDRMDFIPGQVDGKPMPMRYAEPSFGYY